MTYLRKIADSVDIVCVCKNAYQIISVDSIILRVCSLRY